LSTATQRPPRSLAGANPRREPHSRDPHVGGQPEPGSRDFQNARHGYDCRMAARKDIEKLRGEMEELFSDLWYHRLSPQRTGFRPRVDVYRTQDPPAVHVVVELAGVDPDKVDISVAEGALVISGQRQRPAGGERRYEHIEIDYGPFQRRLALGDGLDTSAAEASYEHGLLTIVLPLRRRSSGPIRLKIKKGDES
jgi:HSP20 family protein